jgi:hypothetical protein
MRIRACRNLYNMPFNKQQIRDVSAKLTEEVRDFVTSFEVSDLIENYINETSEISKDNQELADSEVLWSLLGLQTLDSAINNIAQKENKLPTDFSALKSNLENSVFSKLSKIKTSSQEINSSPLEPLENPVPADIDANKGTPQTTEAETSVTNVVPPEENKFEDRKSAVSVPNYSNYDSGKDPYREPIE